MSYNIRYPDINAASTPEQMVQLKSYLHQLVGDLNYALENVGSGSGGYYIVNKNGVPMAEDEEKKDSVARFNDIKALIIKSAEIINAYYEEITKRLEGRFVAISNEFGIFAQETSQTITETSESIRQDFTNIQEIITDRIDNLEHSLIDVQAYIKSGVLYYDDSGVPIYGVEVGQTTEIDGTQTFNKFARFISDRLSFYDQNGIEAAYISDRKLYITHVHIVGSLTQGGFVDTIMADKSIVTKWVGGV